ncbi:hypothetical protein GJU40_11155 [Bacillus lacus]|uniref:YtzH-like protein n=1 Tax=Metabacillus lacus TaxID=1983721 RepID=A0A7X2IZL5_9BACI|nr:YtzH-like family protein [Metabacillus lacus]MRX72706.1 hypothetical protein [Metabacillus lacus]
MPLEYKHQVGLLRDILSEHEQDCCGTVAECEQVERLIKSLMVHTNLDSNLKPILQDIYDYSQSGRNSSELDNHILQHKNELTQWVSDIDQFS